jgi:hypothetical protein
MIMIGKNEGCVSISPSPIEWAYGFDRKKE